MGLPLGVKELSHVSQHGLDGHWIWLGDDLRYGGNPAAASLLMQTADRSRMLVPVEGNTLKKRRWPQKKRSTVPAV